MKRQLKGFVFGVLISVLVVSLMSTAAATLGKKAIDVEYKNLRVFLDGEELSLTDANGKTVEPFAYNGTTFVPVRAISEALGIDVFYYDFESTGFISLDRASPASGSSALNYYYQASGVPRLDNIVGQRAFFDIYTKDPQKIMYTYLPEYFEGYPDVSIETVVSQYQLSLEAAGFKLSTSSEGMYHYTNKSTGIWVSVAVSNYDDGTTTVSVLVDTSDAKTASGSTSTPSSSKSSSDRAEDRPKASAQSTSGTGDTVPTTTDPSKDEAYRQAYIDKRMAEKAAHDKYGETLPESVTLEIETEYQNTLNEIENGA